MTKTPTTNKRRKLYARRPERIRDRHNVHVEVDMSEFLALKSMLVMERMSFSEWLAGQIRLAIK